MNALLRALATTALVAGTTLLGAMGSSVVDAQGAPSTSPVVITVVVTGDPGYVIGEVLLTVERKGDGVRDSQTAVAGGNTFTLRSGSYFLYPTVSDPAYVITGQSCVSLPGSGPGTPDFIVDGNGDGNGVDARCTVNVTYTAPAVPPTEPTTPPTEPTTPPTEPTTPPTEPTTPPTEPTTPPVDSTAPPAATTPPVETTAPPASDDVAALPPAAESDSGTTSGTMPVTGPTDQTLPIAVTGLMMLLLGTGAVVAARRR